MATTQPGIRIVQFGPFEADLTAGELRKAGIKIRLPEQPFRILAALLDRPGDLVTREELRQQLWPDGTFVDFDHSLNAAVNKLREALSDSATNPRFIETVPRRGYRFLLPLEGSAPAVEPRTRLRRLAWLVTLPVVVGTLVGLIWWYRNAETPRPQMLPVPFTTYPGFESGASFSPEGNRVVFVWDGPKPGNLDLYIRQIGGSETPFRLTSDPAHDFGPAWSPDDRYIAFRRLLGADTHGVYLVSPLGGPERKVAEIRGETFPYGDKLGYAPAWHPSGRWLAVWERPEFSAPSFIVLISIESGEKRQLTFPPFGSSGDRNPAFSPDGRSMVFCRFHGDAGELYLLTLSNDFTAVGQPTQLTSENRWSGSPHWSLDGREIIFAHGSKHHPGLYKVEVRGGSKPEPLAMGGHQVTQPAIALHKHRLVYTRFTLDVNIYRIGLADPGDPVKVLSSTWADHMPAYSPDGGRVTFVSDRSGDPEIWVSDSDGGNAIQMTRLGVSGTDAPAWSPDGRSIYFHSPSQARSAIFVVDSQGGPVRKISTGGDDESSPRPSRDGRWIYFLSRRTGEPQVWKRPVAGGEPVRVTKRSGGPAQESADGHHLYYARRIVTPAMFSLWRVPVDGGAEEQVLPTMYTSMYAVVGPGIYFIGAQGPDRRYPLLFYRFATGRTERLITLGLDVQWGLTVSPDQRSVLFVRVDNRGSDLMLVENFR
jgi:Tol biopolymer transport system component/DNA-binding winged helix-turn-helix (wHTH) protein